MLSGGVDMLSSLAWEPRDAELDRIHIPYSFAKPCCEAGSYSFARHHAVEEGRGEGEQTNNLSMRDRGSYFVSGGWGQWGACVWDNEIGGTEGN